MALTMMNTPDQVEAIMTGTRGVDQEVETNGESATGKGTAIATVMPTMVVPVVANAA